MTKANKPVLWVIFGMSWFWFLGSCVLSMLPVFVKDILGGNEQMATYFLGIFTVGMGIGSLLCSRLSKRQAEVGMIPLSLLVMSICLIDFFFVGADFSKPFTGVLYGISEFYQYEHSIRVSLDLLGLSVAGGTFMIPQMTTLQIKSPESQVSSFVASNNIWNAVFMVVGAVFLMGLYAFGLVVFEAFLVLGILNIMVAIVLHFHYSESSWRFLVQIATGFCYKVVPKNEHHIPSEGPFLVVANHTSYVDWAILMAVSPRPLRFVIDHKFYYVPVVQWFLKQVRLIPIATKKESEQILNQAFETIDQSLEDGHVLCIFPEGWITRNGDMRRFQPGVNKILNRKPVPIVPVVIKGLWGSFFSYSGAGVLKGLPNPLRRKVHIEFLEPISAESFDRESLQSTMSELYSDKT
jgi:1-acyl-sn-glycerol-3-phosphate acyltransferase